MSSVPASVYNNADLRLRVWFNDGTLGFQQLTPDQRLAPNGYLPDGAITSAKLAPGTAPVPVKVSGNSQLASVNTSYVATAGGTTTFTLPAQANVGDRIEISGAGSGEVQVLDPTATQAWTRQPGLVVGPALAMSADGTRLYAAGPGSVIYSSADSGANWTFSSPPRGWTAIACSADGTRVAAVVNAGLIYTSTDAGGAWTPRDAVRNWTDVTSSADGTRLAATADDVVYLSSNSGETWSPIPPFPSQGRCLAMSADGMKIAAAGVSSGILLSQDFGATWDRVMYGPYWVGIASSADGTKLVAVAVDDRIYTSTDAGATWTPREQVRTWTGVASSADGTRLIASEFNGRLYVSTDSGVTWGAVESSRVWNGLASSADGRRLMASAQADGLYLNGGVILNANGGSQTSLIATPAGWRALQPYGSWAFADGNLSHTSGNVGVGTANPARALHVNGVITGDGSGLTNLNAAQLTGSVPVASLTSLPAARITGTLPPASLPPDAARRTGGNAFTGTQTIAGGGRLGIGSTNPAASLQVGDAYQANSVGMMRFASTSASLAAWREWEIGVPGATEDVGGKNYSFIIDDLLGGNGQPEVTVRYATGNVGIGTAEPAARLDVDTGGAGRVQIRNEGNFVPGMNVTGGPLPGYLRFRNAFEIWPNDAGTAPGRMDIRNITGAPTITMDGGPGRIGIGRTAVANRLEVEGDASKAVAGAWLANSDRRIKTDIQPVTGALETIAKVNPVTFRYTDDYRKAHPDIKDVPYYNVIAQEFREVFPDAVKSSGEKLPDGSEILQVDTYPATITALAAIKELKAENDALKAANQAMEQRLAAIEEMLRRTQPVNNNPNHQKATP